MPRDSCFYETYHPVTVTARHRRCPEPGQQLLTANGAACSPPSFLKSLVDDTHPCCQGGSGGNVNHEFVVSLIKHPPMKVGTPDPYFPPQEARAMARGLCSP
jgi:hypothetical protein